MINKYYLFSLLCLLFLYRESKGFEQILLKFDKSKIVDQKVAPSLLQHFSYFDDIREGRETSGFFYVDLAGKPLKPKHWNQLINAVPSDRYLYLTKQKDIESVFKLADFLGTSVSLALKLTGEICLNKKLLATNENVQICVFNFLQKILLSKNEKMQAEIKDLHESPFTEYQKAIGDFLYNNMYSEKLFLIIQDQILQKSITQRDRVIIEQVPYREIRNWYNNSLYLKLFKLLFKEGLYITGNYRIQNNISYYYTHLPLKRCFYADLFHPNLVGPLHFTTTEFAYQKSNKPWVTQLLQADITTLRKFSDRFNKPQILSFDQLYIVSDAGDIRTLNKVDIHIYGEQSNTRCKAFRQLIESHYSLLSKNSEYCQFLESTYHFANPLSAVYSGNTYISYDQKKEHSETLLYQMIQYCFKLFLYNDDVNKKGGIQITYKAFRTTRDVERV